MNTQQSNQHNVQSQQESKKDAHSMPSMKTTMPIVAQETVRHWLDFSPDAALVVDSAGTIILLNAQAESLFGYEAGELTMQSLEMLLPQALRGMHVAQRSHYQHAPRVRPMGTGLNLRGQRKDGSEFPVDISLRPFLIGEALHVLGTIRDMTAQHRVAQEHAQLTDQLHLQHCLINFSHDAILVRDPQGHILSWNEGAENLYGWKEPEVLGHLAHTLLSTHFPQSFARFEQRLEQEGHWDGDLIHVCRNGQHIIVESRHIVVRDSEGQPTTILEIDRDVTERRRLEQVEQEVRAEVKARLDVLQLILDRLPTGVFLVQGRAPAWCWPIAPRPSCGVRNGNRGSRWRTSPRNSRSNSLLSRDNHSRTIR